MEYNLSDIGYESFLPQWISDIIKKSQDFRMQEKIREISEESCEKEKCLPCFVYEGELYEDSKLIEKE